MNYELHNLKNKHLIKNQSENEENVVRSDLVSETWKTVDLDGPVFVVWAAQIYDCRLRFRTGNQVQFLGLETGTFCYVSIVFFTCDRNIWYRNPGPISAPLFGSVLLFRKNVFGNIWYFS